MRSRTGLLALVIAAAGVLWRFPPERYGFYPRCPVYAATGWLCPGCGATRAAAALLHGRLLEALQWNALFVVGLGVVLVWGVFRWRTPASWVMVTAWVVTVVFTAGRNLAR